MSVSVNSNKQVILTNTDNVNWEANDKNVEVSNNNYGKVLESKTVDGKYVVTTENGTLTFGAPRLDEAKRVFSDYEISQMNFDDVKGFSWLELAAVVMEAEKLRRKENREARLVARDSAMQQSLNAANELRNAAKDALAMGITSGVIGMATGGLGMAGGLKSLGKSMKALRVKTKGAKFDNDLATNTKDLGKTRQKLNKLKAEGKQNTSEFRQLKNKEVKLEKQQKELLNGIDTEITKTSASKAKDEKKLKKTQNEITDLKKKDLKEPLTAKEQKKLDKLKTKEADLKDDIAIKSDHINGLKETRSKAIQLSNPPSKLLDKQIGDAETSLADANKDLKKTQKDIKAAENEGDEIAERTDLDDATKKAKLDKIDARLTKLEAKEANLKADINTKEGRLSDLKEPRSTRQANDQANVDKATSWEASSQKKLDGLNRQIDGAQADSQRASQVLNAFQMIGGSARGGLDTGSQFVQTDAQADAQEMDAEATKLKAEEEEANAEFQDSNRAIQAFKDCWERCEDSRNQTRQNLANWPV